MKDEKIHIVHLEAVEDELRQFKDKYGVEYEEFMAKLERGELGDPYSYELERDAMEWGDLSAEKQILLDQFQNHKSKIKNLGVLNG